MGSVYVVFKHKVADRRVALPSLFVCSRTFYCLHTFQPHCHFQKLYLPHIPFFGFGEGLNIKTHL